MSKFVTITEFELLPRWERRKAIDEFLVEVDAYSTTGSVVDLSILKTIGIKYNLFIRDRVCKK